MINSMEAQVELLKQDLKREFNQTEFQKHRLFPWALDSRTWKKIIQKDLITENILNPRIEGEGYGTRYFIKSKNIIKYIGKYGSLKMGEIQKPKQTWQKKQPRKKSQLSK